MLARLLIPQHVDAQMSKDAVVPAGVAKMRDFSDSGKNPAVRRVLVVDDEALLRWSVAETLATRGYDITEATDGRSALQQFGEGDHTDLVLLDPCVRSSFDLCALARMRQKRPQVPVIVMTAFPTREIVEAATAPGASVLVKPFELDALTATVERALALGVA